MTDDAVWSAVDHYVDDLFVGDDEALTDALKASANAGLPAIQVSPAQGKFLHVLAQSIGAKRILEIGTLGGYSAIWMARALSGDGRLVTIEADAMHARVARENFTRAGVADRIDLRHGFGLDVLPKLVAERAGPFDLVFIDADKPGYTEYLDWAIKLARPGTLVVADNIVRHGDVTDKQSSDPAVQGARRFNAALAADSRVTATILQTVGSKGYDGFAFAVVK